MGNFIMRKIINVLQGSDDWHQFRSNHFGASEASACLGLSPYKTRTQLLHEKKTGLSKEFSRFVQERILDNGHRVESIARPIVEKLINEDLSPMTFSNGKLSASCDGISFMGDIAWENKQFGAEHYEQVKSGVLPEIHWPQCQQVMYCSGADKLFFTISDGTEERTAGVWVSADEKLQRQLVAEWAQFEKDLEDYVIPVHVEKVEAETVQTLPVPSVVVKGEITASNLSEITPLFDGYLSNIKTELSTDSDFADAEANAKNCRETAKRIEALQENIIAQMVSVNEINSVLGNYKEAFNKVGLRLEKAVKEQKETLKANAIMKAKADYTDFVTALNKDIPVPISDGVSYPNFAAAIKGVKTLESMQSRINDALAKGKSEATIYADEVKIKIAYIGDKIKGYEHLINVPSLAAHGLEYIKLYIQSQKDAEDKRKEEHEAQIKEKAEADARAKLEAEAKAKEAAEIKAREELEAKIIEESKATQDGDAIINDIINQADFNNVFEVKEQSAVQVGSVRPTAQAIINLVAKTYNVDAATANRWLGQSFGELKKVE